MLSVVHHYFTYCPYYVLIEEASVPLESTACSGEKPQDAVIFARRKLFQLPIQEIPTSSEDERDQTGSRRFNHLGDHHIHTASPPEREAAMVRSTAMQSDWQQRGEDAPKRFPQIPQHGKSDSEACSQATFGMEQRTIPSKGSNFSTLLHAKLLTKSPQEHYLILTFPRIVTDYWSSALFSQQLTNAYTQLEKVSGPGLTHYRPGGQKVIKIGQPGTAVHSSMRRGAVGGVYGCPGNALGRGTMFGGSGATRFPRLSSARTKTEKKPAATIHVRFPPQMHFKQVSSAHVHLCSATCTSWMLHRPFLFGFLTLVH